MPTGFAFYDILEVEKNATPDEIKKAYRKLAVQKHPDKGGNPEEFKKLSEAYQVLSEQDKRSMYDQLGDKGYVEHAQGGGMPTDGSFDPFDIFKQFFGGMGPGGGFGGFGGFGFPHEDHFGRGHKKTVNHTINVSLEEAYKGVTKRIRISDDKSCQACMTTCRDCNGTGAKTHQLRMGPMVQMVTSACTVCQGKGKSASKPAQNCPSCSGKGKITESHTLELQVPSGVSSGAQVHLNVSDTLDMLVTIGVQSHPMFLRKGDDLVMEVQLTLREAFLGKVITIPLFDEKLVVSTQEKGIIYDGQKEIIKGRGMPDISRGNGKMRGDLIIIYQVVSYQGSNRTRTALHPSVLAAFANAFDALDRIQVSK